jgi:thiol-disulfide isomerase/thioredoxin
MKKILLLALFLTTGLTQAKDLLPYDGAPLPNFTLNDLQGRPHTLSEYRGKVVMLNFWATYCGPCIKEMPSMQRLNEKMSGKPFVILAVDMAEEQADVEAFFSKHKIKVDFPLLLDPDGGVVEQWMISAVPTTFILDPEGTIRYALFGGLEWDKDEVITTLNGLMK